MVFPRLTVTYSEERLVAFLFLSLYFLYFLRRVEGLVESKEVDDAFESGQELCFFLLFFFSLGSHDLE